MNYDFVKFKFFVFFVDVLGKYCYIFIIVEVVVMVVGVVFIIVVI